MNREQAQAESNRKYPGSRSLRCIWYCGLINGQIRKAARLGEKEVRILFPRGHYVVAHQELFQKLYEDQGFTVSITPDYQYIQPTEWTMKLSWEEDGT